MGIPNVILAGVCAKHYPLDARAISAGAVERWALISTINTNLRRGLM
jgi:hypothetical protein